MQTSGSKIDDLIDKFHTLILNQNPGEKEGELKNEFIGKYSFHFKSQYSATGGKEICKGCEDCDLSSKRHINICSMRITKKDEVYKICIECFRKNQKVNLLTNNFCGNCGNKSSLLTNVEIKKPSDSTFIMNFKNISNIKENIQLSISPLRWNKWKINDIILSICDECNTEHDLFALNCKSCDSINMLHIEEIRIEGYDFDDVDKEDSAFQKVLEYAKENNKLLITVYYEGIF